MTAHSWRWRPTRRTPGWTCRPRRCARASTRFADDPTKTFLPYFPGAVADPRGLLRADLGLSLDVLFHLVEPTVFETYLRDLFALSQRYVLIYASDGPRDSTIGSVTDRPFTTHLRATQPDWQLVERVPNPHAWDGNVATSTRSDFFVYQRSVSSPAG